MNERERLLDKIAEHQALVMHGTLDLTIEQWAVIYDRVEWTYRKTATETLADVIADDDPVDYYDEELARECAGVDKWAAEERTRVRAGRELTTETSFEVSFA